MQAIQILPYILSVFSYLLPICYFLPFKLKLREKVILFIILLINILLIGFVLGNIGVILLILSTCIYIAFLDHNRLMNICVFIATYLFCVLWDNLFSLLWDTFIYPIANLQSHLTYYIFYIISYIVLLACICPIIGRLLHLIIHKIHAGLTKQLLLLIATNLATCLFIFLFNIVIGEYIGYSRKIITFNCILFACYFIISTVLIVNIIKAHMDKVDMNMRQDSYNRLQEYTNQIENMYSSLRSFKHDYSNIMLSMSGYIEANDMEGLKDYFGKRIDIDYYYRHPRSYCRRGIFSVNEPSPTIRGVNRPIPNGYQIHSNDPVQSLAGIRPLTTKERSMIQTFPEDFIFIGGKSDLEQMIGNAVPIKLGAFVAASILSYIGSAANAPSHDLPPIYAPPFLKNQAIFQENSAVH